MTRSYYLFHSDFFLPYSFFLIESVFLSFYLLFTKEFLFGDNLEVTTSLNSGLPNDYPSR